MFHDRMQIGGIQAHVDKLRYAYLYLVKFLIL